MYVCIIFGFVSIRTCDIVCMFLMDCMVNEIYKIKDLLFYNLSTNKVFKFL